MILLISCLVGFLSTQLFVSSGLVGGIAWTDKEQEDLSVELPLVEF